MLAVGAEEVIVCLVLVVVLAVVVQAEHPLLAHLPRAPLE
jgi:hypothetical protein